MVGPQSARAPYVATQAYASKLSDAGLPEFGPITPVGRSWMGAMLSGRRFSVEQVIRKGDRADGASQASVCRNPEGSDSSGNSQNRMWQRM